MFVFQILDLDEAIRLSAKLGLAYNARAFLSEDIGNKVYDLTKVNNSIVSAIAAISQQAYVTRPSMRIPNSSRHS